MTRKARKYISIHLLAISNHGSQGIVKAGGRDTIFELDDVFVGHNLPFRPDERSIAALTSNW